MRTQKMRYEISGQCQNKLTAVSRTYTSRKKSFSLSSGLQLSCKATAITKFMGMIQQEYVLIYLQHRSRWDLGRA